MVPGLIGLKLGMTRVFLSDGEAVPVTVLRVGPCKVVQKKVEAKEGYNSVQLGFYPKKEHRMTKPVLGHFKAAGVESLAYLREFRVADPGALEVGQEFSVELFRPGERVHVTATSKGRGFAGVMKRHGFGGGRASHGSKTHRAPGSIGMSAYPARVIKGKKMPGHMGNARTTVKNLVVVDARPEQNLLLVKGAVPGARNGLVIVRKAAG